MTTYPNTRMTVSEGNCGGDGDKFVAWLAKHHPEIEVEYRRRTDGFGDGHWNEDGEEIDSRLWEKYCAQAQDD